MEFMATYLQQQPWFEPFWFCYPPILFPYLNFPAVPLFRCSAVLDLVAPVFSVMSSCMIAVQ